MMMQMNQMNQMQMQMQMNQMQMQMQMNPMQMQMNQMNQMQMQMNQINQMKQMNQMQMNQMRQMNQMQMQMEQMTKKVVKDNSYKLLINQNAINSGQYNHISIETRICNRLSRLSNWLMLADFKKKQKEFYRAAKEMILLYYCFKLSPNSQRVINSFVTEAKVNLETMKENLKKQDIEDRFKFELGNFIFDISKFDDIYQAGKKYFNLITMFNMKYESSKCSRDDRGNTTLIVKQTGLKNIGATCYMNATLQSFIHAPGIGNYFKFYKSPDSKSKRLCTSFAQTIKELCDSQTGWIAPHNFKDTISDMEPLFRGIAANDSKDLVNFMIMTLHLELNKPPEANNVQGGASPDQRNFYAMLNAFAQAFYQKNRTIISDLLYGINCGVTNCQGKCSTTIYNCQTYFFLVYPLEEVRKRAYETKYRNYGYNLNQITTVSLQDCFDYDAKGTCLSGESAMYCNYCHTTAPGIVRTKLVTVPKILILLFNRGKGIEFNVNVKYYKHIDQYTMGDMLLSNNKVNMKWKVRKIFSTVTHIGESGMGGHFISFTESRLDGQYYKFNDAIVEPSQDVISVSAQSSFVPYLLFCREMEPEEIIHEVEDVVSDHLYRCCILGKLTNLTDEIKREKFTYLLGCAMLKSEEYGLASDNESNLICATFELIKMETEFSEEFMEGCRVIICEMASWTSQRNSNTPIGDIIQEINNCSFLLPNGTGFNVSIFTDASYYLDTEVAEVLEENQHNPYNPYNPYNSRQNNIINNDVANIALNNNNININNGNNESDSIITIDFKLKNNKTVDFVVGRHENISLKDVFNSAKKAYPNEFQDCRYENPVFYLEEVPISSEETIANLIGDDTSNKITFKVEEQKNELNFTNGFNGNSTTENLHPGTDVTTRNQSSYQQSGINGGHEKFNEIAGQSDNINKRESNLQSKLSNESKSKLIWLKIFFTSIFVIVAIFLIILKLYWFTLIPVNLVFSVYIVPKLRKPCCGCLSISSDYSYNDNQNQHDNSFENVPNRSIENYNQIS